MNINEIKRVVKSSKLSTKNLMEAIGFNAVSYYDSLKREDFKASVLISLANYTNNDVRIFFNEKDKLVILQEPSLQYGKAYTLEEKVKNLTEINKLLNEKIEYLKQGK